MNTLLILENDPQLDKVRHSYVYRYLETWEGDIIDFSGLRFKSKIQIKEALDKCTHIFTQTCFVNGSDSQFFEFVKFLSSITKPKVINIALLGSDLFDYLNDSLSDKELIDLSHHFIYEYKYADDYSKMDSKFMDFSERLNIYKAKIKKTSDYNASAIDRKTGTKIKLLACNASGNAFKGLIIGNIYDELDMSKTDPNKKRGVWIWGNGEPIKLVNDCGLEEYEIVSNINFDSFCDEVFKSTSLNILNFSKLELVGLLSILEDEETSDLSAANFICEATKTQKRYNRQIIAKLIHQLRESKETV